MDLLNKRIPVTAPTPLSPEPASLTLLLCSTFRPVVQLSRPLRARVRHQWADLSQCLRGPLPGFQGPPVCLRPMSPKQPVHWQTLPEEPEVGPSGAASSGRDSVVSLNACLPFSPDTFWSEPQSLGKTKLQLRTSY